jgi:hypothetical protein
MTRAKSIVTPEGIRAVLQKGSGTSNVNATGTGETCTDPNEVEKTNEQRSIKKTL